MLTTQASLSQAALPLAPFLLDLSVKIVRLGIMSRPSLVAAPMENVVKTVQQEQKFLTAKLTTLMNYVLVVAAGCKTYVGNEYGALKAKGVQAFALEKFAQVRSLTSKPSVKVTALSAASGAVTVGAGGGLLGMAAGAGVGAAVGVVPAIFTFGLSIPVGAFMGGAFGLCAGTAVGGSAGLVGGGSVGYYGYEHRAEIKSAAKGVTDKANAYTSSLKQRALASKEYAISLVSGTGGTKD